MQLNSNTAFRTFDTSASQEFNFYSCIVNIAKVICSLKLPNN